MTITVTESQPKRSDAFWTEIQSAIGALVGDTDGRLTRISRPDGHCDYRDHGTYQLTYTATEETHITLILS